VEIKIALPKGRLLKRTSALLHKAGWGIDEYHSRISFYHPRSQRFPSLIIKVLHEKDIPIQVAVGNYDLGICSLDWIEELLVKYPSSAVVKVRDLGYGQGILYMVAGASQAGTVKEQLKHSDEVIRIASEYPNLAELFALQKRLSRFSIFPVWGAAEVYPPENAELALIAVKSASELNGKLAVEKVLESSSFLIANRTSWEKKDLAGIINSVCDVVSVSEKPASHEELSAQDVNISPVQQETGDVVRLALPDGHQQQPTVELLNRAGIQVDDYPSDSGNRRPGTDLDGVEVKVIRPQDMPLQVANGNFDLAVTGRDWLEEHLCQFLSSPVQELLNLDFGKVRVVAVVSQDLPADNTISLRQLVAGWQEPLRVASEYVQLADRYARENHLSPYRVIPTWGSTEAFLPEDADLLIENTQTGRTIARHNLKIVDTLFESTACLIGGKRDIDNATRRKRIDSIVRKLRTALEEA